MMSRKKLNFLTVLCLFVCLKAIQCQDNVKSNDCPKCIHGHCDELNRCECLPPFGGENCDKMCPFARFGQFCEHDCSDLFNFSSNKNWSHCNCGGTGEIRKECKDTCKCDRHLFSCPKGLIGKKCGLSCPFGTFGYLCLEKCKCNENNTLKCDKEKGECKCKKSFYGFYCEKECKGNLICHDSSKTSCTCEATVEQKIEEINQKVNETKDHLVGRIDETKDHFYQKFNESKLHFERKVDEVKQSKDHLLAILCCVTGFLLLSSCLVYRYKMKSKKLKNDLKVVSIKYSNESNDNEFNNPMYDLSLLPDSKKYKKSNFLKNFISENLYKKEQKASVITEPTAENKSVNSGVYASISEVKSKTDNETILMPETNEN